MTFQKQTLAEEILDCITEHEKKKEKNVFSIHISDRKKILCTIVSVGKDYIVVKDDSKRVEWITLSAGTFRDVTGLEGFEFKHEG